MQETWVQSLIWDDLTCHRLAEPMCHNYWACALELRSHDFWARVPSRPCSATREAISMRSPRTTTREQPLLSATVEKPTKPQRPSTTKKKWKFILKKVTPLGVSFCWKQNTWDYAECYCKIGWKFHTEGKMDWLYYVVNKTRLPALSENKGLCNHQGTTAAPMSLQWVLRELRMGKKSILAPESWGANQKDSFNELRLLHLPIYRKVLNSLTWDVWFLHLLVFWLPGLCCKNPCVYWLLLYLLGTGPLSSEVASQAWVMFFPDK